MSKFYRFFVLCSNLFSCFSRLWILWVHLQNSSGLFVMFWQYANLLLHFKTFYATLAYVRHFIFAGCYDNDPWYLVTNFAGHLDFAGFYFSKCPAKFVTRYQVQALIFSSCDGGRPNFKYIDFASVHKILCTTFYSYAVKRREL